MTVRSLVDLLYELPPDAPVAMGTKLELGAGDAAAITFKKLNADIFSGIVVLFPTEDDDNDITFITKDRIIPQFKED